MQQDASQLDLAQLLQAVTGEMNRALDAEVNEIDLICSEALDAGKTIFAISISNPITGELIFTAKAGGDPQRYRQKLKHEVLKDYILWFTKFGSVEREFGKTLHAGTVLFLQGLGRDAAEKISFGHVFPAESEGPDALFEQYSTKAPQYYCKRFFKTGVLENFPEISYEAVFSVEGDKVKEQYNPLLVRSGQAKQDGQYTVQDRYGVWLCKDYVPVQRKNEWIVKELLRTTDFHAFFNCQGLSVQRGSVDETPAAILADIKAEIQKITAEIAAGDDQASFGWLVYAVCSGL